MQYICRWKFTKNKEKSGKAYITMTKLILGFSMNYIKVRHTINEFEARDIDRQQPSHLIYRCEIGQSDRCISPNQS